MKQIKKIIMSFVHAGRGIADGFGGRSFKIQVLAAILVIALGFVVKLSVEKWAIIIILIAVVLSAELFNSSIESLSDIVRDTQKLEYSVTRKARDLAAGAVLVIAIVAVVIAALVFLV